MKVVLTAFQSHRDVSVMAIFYNPYPDEGKYCSYNHFILLNKGVPCGNFLLTHAQIQQGLVSRLVLLINFVAFKI